MVRSRLLTIVLLGATAAMLAACTSDRFGQEDLRYKSQYWQRKSTTSAIYTQGPKALQMLNRDIARCVTEIRELQRLGILRHTLPGQLGPDGIPNPETPPGALAQWETPQRDGMLHAEHLEYHDFETCMTTKGWERVEHVPYDIGKKARDTYIESITGEQYRSQTGDRQPPAADVETDWDSLNP